MPVYDPSTGQVYSDAETAAIFTRGNAYSPVNPPPVPSGSPYVTDMPGTPQFTSQDVTRILNAFRTQGMTPETLYAQLRAIGYSAELANNVVQNELAARQTVTAATPSSAAPLGAAPQPPPPLAAQIAAGTGGLLGGGGLGTPAGIGGDFPLGVGNFGNEKFVPFAGGAALDTSGVAPSLGALASRSLESQPLQDVFRRVGEELYGPRTPLQANVLTDLIDKFSRFSPITQAGFGDFTGDERAQAFRQFVNSPLPSGIELGGQLANILGRQSEPQFSTFASGLENERAQPGSFERIGEGAFNVGTTPFLQRLSPFVRSGAARALEEQFRQMFARDPTRFQSPQDIFNELQRRRFIPSYAAVTGFP